MEVERSACVRSEVQRKRPTILYVPLPVFWGQYYPQSGWRRQRNATNRRKTQRDAAGRRGCSKSQRNAAFRSDLQTSSFYLSQEASATSFKMKGQEWFSLSALTIMTARIASEWMVRAKQRLACDEEKSR